MTKVPHPPINYAPMIFIAALVAAIINGGVIGWVLWASAQRPHVELGPPLVLGTNVICPEQTLSYKFTLAVSKAADVDLNVSVEALSPRNTISYSRFQRYSFDAKTDIEITRQWMMPPTYLDPELGRQVTWRPGKYVQRTSANVIGGREGPSEIEVNFIVPNRCVVH